MAKVPSVNYAELDEFVTIPTMCGLLQIDKAELKQKCVQYHVKPRRNEIGQYGFVKYDFCKLHNLLYYKNRNDSDHTQPLEDDPNPNKITGSLESMRRIVGGLITAFYPFAEQVALVCHDEGKLIGLPPNRAVREPSTGKIMDIIAGTFSLASVRQTVIRLLAYQMNKSNATLPCFIDLNY